MVISQTESSSAQENLVCMQLKPISEYLSKIWSHLPGKISYPFFSPVKNRVFSGKLKKHVRLKLCCCRVILWSFQVFGVMCIRRSVNGLWTCRLRLRLHPSFTACCRSVSYIRQHMETHILAEHPSIPERN